MLLKYRDVFICRNGIYSCGGYSPADAVKPFINQEGPYLGYLVEIMPLWFAPPLLLQILDFCYADELWYPIKQYEIYH